MIKIGYLVILGIQLASASVNKESHLYAQLLTTGYNPHLRPVDGADDVVDVDLEFTLISIGGLSDTDQVLTTLGYLTSSWTDVNLKWTPSAWGDVEELVIPPSDVWLPDIAIANSVNTIYKKTYSHDFRVHVKHTGRVLWNVADNFETSCTLDLTFYPFDVQVCDVIVENWSYTQDAVNLKISHGKMGIDSAFSANGEWELHDTVATVTTYEKDTHPGKKFPMATFTVKLNRKQTYYLLNIILPCMFCVIIALSIFWMPPESGEKIGLGVTVLLTFSVFQLVVADNTPKTSDHVPMLTLLMVSIMATTTVSVMNSIVVLYLYHHPTTARPARAARKLVFNQLAKVVCMTGAPQIESGESAADSISLASLEKQPSERSEIQQVLRCVQYFKEYTEDQSAGDSIADDWKYLALVVDRIMFCLVLLAACVLHIVFLGQRGTHP